MRPPGPSLQNVPLRLQKKKKKVMQFEKECLREKLQLSNVLFFTVTNKGTDPWFILASEVTSIPTLLAFTEGERLRRTSWKHFLIKPKALICHPTPGWSRQQQQANCQKIFWGDPDHNIPLDALPCAGVPWICAQLKVGKADDDM